mmetsp:Transcript_130778/g.406675  ORF Transcript_130778/g.406675 Transcript_130778/m.406675 type:complete len:290 (-) Transcript_130778:183-1052(-)
MGQGAEHHGTEDDLSRSPGGVAVLLRLIDSSFGRVLLFVLLAVDIATVVASGFLDAHFLVSQVDDCKAYINTCVPGVHTRRLGSEERGAAWRQLGAAAQCGLHPHFGNHTLHDVEKICAYVSMAILSIFLVEQVLRIVATRGSYLRSPLHILDIFVIGTSLALEILVTHLPLGGLVVLGRIWRFARTGFTTAEGLHDMSKVRPALTSLAHDALHAAWARLPEERWKHISLHREDKQLNLEFDEVRLAVEIAHASPAFVLQALARENERLRDAGHSVMNLETLTGRNSKH